jgi:hypothetical protein
MNVNLELLYLELKFRNFPYYLEIGTILLTAILVLPESFCMRYEPTHKLISRTCTQILQYKSGTEFINTTMTSVNIDAMFDIVLTSGTERRNSTRKSISSLTYSNLLVDRSLDSMTSSTMNEI